MPVRARGGVSQLRLTSGFHCASLASACTDTSAEERIGIRWTAETTLAAYPAERHFNLTVAATQFRQPANSANQET
jgi:hypothetical protein